MIWETKPPATSYVGSICPSRDGQRLLVGHYDGSVRMWDLGLDLGLKDSAINQADTTNTQDDTDMQQVITLSHSGKVVATKPQKSRNIEFLDTATREVVARTDIEHGENMEIAFSPDEDQVAFLSESLITICDITQPGERISFNPWPGKNVHRQKVAFQTYNDLVVCAISRDDDSTLLQVWHRQGPAEFERTYSSDIKTKQFSYPFLAPNGLPLSSFPFPNLTLHVIRGITTMPSLTVSNLTIKCISTGNPHYLCIHLTGNTSHVGLGVITMSESGTHELINSFTSFQRPGWMKSPSHLI